jgi:REP element-mobilizing transposase RayT
MRLKNILLAVAAQYGVLIETMEVMPDHVHLLVSSDPTQGRKFTNPETRISTSGFKDAYLWFSIYLLTVDSETCPTVPA